MIDIGIATTALVLLGSSWEEINSDLQLFGLTLLTLFVYIIIYLVKRYFYRSNTALQLNLPWVDTVILTMGALLVSYGIMIWQMGDYRQSERFVPFLIITAIITVALAISVIYSTLKQKRYQSLAEIRAKLNEQQKQYHQQLIKKEQDTRKFRHDFSQHISIIRQLNAKQDLHTLQNYIENLQETYDTIHSDIATGNYITDVITNDLHGKYSESNIQLKWRGLFPPRIEMKDSDISSLLANLLKNAYEATEKVTSTDREIHVDIKIFNEDLIISISNPTVTYVQRQNNKFITTKKNKKEHGFGTEIIQDIVEKNQGQINYHIEQNKFSIEILLRKMVKTG